LKKRLTAGIIDDEKIPRVVERLFASDIFGLRRYGFDDRVLQLARALNDLAKIWPGGTRIPVHIHTLRGHRKEWDASHRSATADERDEGGWRRLRALLARG